MTITIQAFGIAKEIFRKPSLELELKEKLNVADLKAILENKYPLLKELGTYMIAVNNDYGEDSTIISLKDEIAIIPPVSGG
jgi:molybdopterin synthase sulfur carrier subunit